MSEEKIDVKKLTVSQAIELLLDGKIKKAELEDVFDRDDLFKKLSYKELENLLYRQSKESSLLPRELKIKSKDILHQYGRNINGAQLMDLAHKGYVSEADVLKALYRGAVLEALVEAKPAKEEDKKAPSKEEQDDEEVKEEEPEKIKPIEKKEEEQRQEQEETELVSPEILDKETVKDFFTSNRLVKMFFANKLTREFTDAYEDAFKNDQVFNDKKSKEIIKELKEIFGENLQALYVVLMRFHFRGMLLTEDIKGVIQTELFTEKVLEQTVDYDVIDKDGNVLYSYKKETEKRVKLLPGETSLEEEEQEEEPVTYPILEPVTKEEIVDAYRDETIDDELFTMFFTENELLQMFKQKKVSIRVFTLFSAQRIKKEVIRAYNEGYVSFEEIMELFFEYDGLTTEELKDVIDNIPKKVAISRYITDKTDVKKINELYRNRLISFRDLSILRYQLYISEEDFARISQCIDKDEFYESIQSKVFHTNVVEEKEDEEVESEEAPKAELFNTEITLFTKVIGIPEEELETISVIDSKDDDGNPTTLDGYKIIPDKKDGLVIIGKFDYVSPIYVMTYEEAAYFLRSRGEDDSYIYDDLMFVQRLEQNEQIRVVEHDEKMAQTIVQAMCELSEEANERYLDDEQYMLEVLEYIREIDEKYVEMIKETNNNM